MFFLKHGVEPGSRLLVWRGPALQAGRLLLW